MEYGKLIRDAWTITWRYRFLWVLGLLASGSMGVPGLNGSGAGSGPTLRGQPGDLDRVNPGVAAAASEISAWATVNVGLLIALAGLVTVLVLALIILSVIAQGGMSEATADLARGQTSSLGRAWNAGLHLFWRYVGLWLMLAAAAVLVAFAIALVVGASIGVSILGQSPLVGLLLAIAAIAAVVVGFDYVVLRLFPNTAMSRWLVVLLSTLFALPLFTVLLTAALILSIVVAFAQRAIAVENIGPIAALRSGWHLMTAHLGDSLMTWLINVVLTLAYVIAGLAGLLGILVVLGGMGALVFAFAGFTAPTFAYVGVGSLIFIAVVLTVTGMANTFFWTYWTLAYLRLSGRGTAAV